jgi:anti-sigma regulatory factor (Ser/Thr protein kinase)
MALWRRLRERIRKWRVARGGATRREDATTASRVAVAFDSGAHTWLFRIARDRAAISEFCACLDRRLPGDYASADALRAFQVSFDELLTNVVMHADGPSAEPIDVLLRRDADAVIAVLRYRSSPYDPTARGEPDTDTALTEREVGGLGVHLVRRLMKRFEYRYDNGCNEVTLTRNRH